jgi:hypothetical protein
MIDDMDVKALKDSKRIIENVSKKIDCHYCREHVDLVLDLLDDIIDISKFNTLYKDDPEALNRYRQIMQSESMLRIMAIGSKIIGLKRRLGHVFGKP